MKYTPEDSILSGKAKKNKKDADLKSYFENTHQVFTPSWIKYKNPSLKSEEEEGEEDEKPKPKGMALLKKIYGGGSGFDEKEGGSKIDNPELYEKARQIADEKYSKPSAYKSGFIVKTYKELGGTYSGKKENKGIGRWFKEGWSDIGGQEYPVYRPTKRVSKDTPLTADEIDPQQAKKQIKLKQKIRGKSNLPPFKPKGGYTPCKTSCKAKVSKRFDEVVDNYQDVINHLEEHQAEGVGDPMDVKQSKLLKKDIKRINALHLQEADKIGTSDPLYQVSNPRQVQKEAREIYGKDAIVYKSSNPKKKYQIQDKNTGKWVFFGDAKMEDFTKHQDPVRRERYLKRALGIKGKWRENPFSPNTLSILLLW